MLAKHYHKDIKVRRLGLDQWPRQEFSYLPDAGLWVCKASRRIVYPLSSSSRIKF